MAVRHGGVVLSFNYAGRPPRNERIASPAVRMTRNGEIDLYDTFGGGNSSIGVVPVVLLWAVVGRMTLLPPRPRSALRRRFFAIFVIVDIVVVLLPFL